MIVIDDKMFKLAKMQETLLRATTINREENLDKYKAIVTEIDSVAYQNILETLKHMDEHNQTLEEEVKFLQSIKDSYEELNELQLSFKKVYENYSDEQLKLSDLSKLNIEQLETRINTINGYLINLKNIESNKKTIQELNDRLIAEEKRKEQLDRRLLELEQMLRYNFVSAEGRIIINGELKYTSVTTEYQKLELNFEQLLDNGELIETLIEQIESESKEIQEKLSAAKICYINYPNSDSKQILDEINKDNLKIKYKLTMLHIARLIATDCNTYDSFKEKRQKLLTLIKERLSYVYSLGINVPIDPFSRTKVEEQSNALLTMTDNSKNITRIRKEIAELTTRIEEMISQNSTYLFTLNDTKGALKINIGINDIDISNVIVDENIEPSEEKEIKQILSNQVKDIKTIPDSFKVSIVRQKTSGVIKRVNQMMTSPPVSIPSRKTSIIPELVIVPAIIPSNKKEESNQATDSNKEELDIFEDLSKNTFEEESSIEPTSEENLDIFQTTIPFLEPVMFNDREEESLVSETTLSSQELDAISDAKDNLELSYTEDEMPELFWNTEEQDELVEEEPSFDDQINMLLSMPEQNTQVYKKERKLAA